MLGSGFRVWGIRGLGFTILSLGKDWDVRSLGIMEVGSGFGVKAWGFGFLGLKGRGLGSKDRG